MENQIIKIAEYILSIINNISNFQEFQNNKYEIINSVEKIVLCCNYIQNMKFSTNFNKTKQKNNNIDNAKSTVSNILGLQFNYDSYLTESDAKFLIEYEDNKNNILKTLSKTNKSTLKTNDFNSIFIDQKNKNLKNKHKNNKKDIISNIIYKINNDENIPPILFNLFGKNIKEKLLSNNISDGFLDQIKNVINEIEKIKFQSIRNEIFDKDGNIPDLLSRKFCCKTFNSIQNSEPKIETNYRRPLRYQTYKNLKISFSDNNINRNKNNYSKKSKNSNNTDKIHKNKNPFINTAYIYEKYFDEPLKGHSTSKLSNTCRYFTENQK